MYVLITDVESRKGFDLVNIVQRSLQYQPLLAAPKHTRFRLPLIYTQKIHRLRDTDQLAFAEDLQLIFQDKGAENIIYIPVSEKYTQLFYQFLQNHPACPVKYLLPEEKNFNLCRNKDRFQQFGEEKDWPVPRSYSAETLASLATDFRPLVLKKKVGAGSVGLKFVNRQVELSVIDTLNMEEYLVQEKVQGNGVIFGGFYLCQNGEVVTYHGHQRLRTFPEKAGVTVFSKAENIAALRDIGAQVLRQLNWNGIAMIEFMYDEHSQSWKIIELNPRLWGSVLLTHYCRSKLLENYLRLCAGEPVSSYQVDTERYIQWVFPFELLGFFKRKITFSELLGRNKQVCRINISYSSWYRTMAYLLYFTVNLSLIRRFFKKLDQSS